MARIVRGDQQSIIEAIEAHRDGEHHQRNAKLFKEAQEALGQVIKGAKSVSVGPTTYEVSDQDAT